MVIAGALAGVFADAEAQRRPKNGGDWTADELACQLESGGESTVLAIAGPQTLKLADGRFVRLAEILVPTLPQPSTGFDPSAAAQAWLRAAALGRKVEIKFGGTRRDRYGVYLAHVYVSGEIPMWLQEGLTGAGFAQAYPQADNHACAARLLAAEVKARQEQLGHWGLAVFKILKANDKRGLFTLAQTYQIVEGIVDHSSESGGRVSLYFNAEEKNGLVAILEPSAAKLLGKTGQPNLWKGQQIRVRGWVDRRRQPTIAITHKQQIEMLSGQATESPNGNR